MQAGETLLVAFNLPCLMSEYFSDPLCFDIDRFAPGRDESRQPGVFAPFGIGRHFCLGAGLAEALCALEVAMTTREVDAVLPPDSRMKFERAFSMRPKYEFRFVGRKEAN